MNMKNRHSSFYLGCLITLIFSVVIAFPSGAHACSCNGNPNPPCRAYGNADAVFDAVVTGREKIERSGVHVYLNSRRYQLEVERVFKGDVPSATYVYTGVGDSDCGYRFQVGKRYLIYAHRSEGRFTTSICTRTTTIKNASEDLDHIVKWPLLPNGITIFGKVERRSFDGKTMSSEPLSGFEIAIDGSEKRKVRTSSEGTYSITALPAGPYSVGAVPLPGDRLSAFSSVDLFPYALFEERIPEKACLQADFVFER